MSRRTLQRPTLPRQSRQAIIFRLAALFDLKQRQRAPLVDSKLLDRAHARDDGLVVAYRVDSTTADLIDSMRRQQ